MTRVLLADDHVAVRDGLRAVLADQRDIEVVGEAADGPSTVAAARDLRPDLIILDNSMPGMTGLDVARTLRDELPWTGIVFLTMDPGIRDLAITAGATAFVTKDAPSDELIRAVRATAQALVVRRRLNDLVPGWRRVLELLVGSRAATEAQIQTALAERAQGESFVMTLLRRGVLGQAELADVLARASVTPLVSLAPYPELGAAIDPTESRLSSVRLLDPVERAAARLLPLDLARPFGVVVIASDGQHGVLAMADPLDDVALAEAERHARLRLTRVTATLEDIQETLVRAFGSDAPAPVVWLGKARGFISTLAVMAVIGVIGFGAFFFLVRDALAPRFALSLFALLCGLFFFLYALKYYVTIASVLLITLFGDPLKFTGRNGNGHANGNGHTNGEGNGLKADGHTKGNGHGIGRHKEGYRTLRGENLSEVGAVVVNDPWQKIGEIRLPADRQPFVSIHLALYNESRVVDRLLTACTSFDYENYEVIVADDSTDETVELLKKWQNHPRVRIIHRSSRKGFKGGALQEALRRMNPKTEYVMVFDADFVPPADAIWHFLDYFGRLSKKSGNGHNGNGHATNGNGHGAPQNGDRLAVVQGYQWHMLNASENWITKGVRAEFSGSYVLERSGQELFGAMKMISGSVYMIRADVLRKLGWSTSITEDWELTIRLYLAGYKVLYTPYIQAPAECVSTVSRLIKQRMRWAEGHTYNVKKYFWPVLRSPNLTWQEKLEFVYYAPYYLQSVLFSVATVAWIVGVLILGQKLPMWGEVFGWSLVISNALALPLMNLTGVLLEGSLRRDVFGLLSFIGLSWILVPFQAYASVKALFEKREGGWVRTPKSGRVTEALERFHLARLMPWELPKRRRGQGKPSSGSGRFAAAAVVVLAAAGIITVGALSIRAAATSGAATETDLVVPALVGTAVPLAILALGWLRLRRRVTAVVLAFTLGLGTNVVYLANAVPAAAVTDNSSVFTFANTTSYSTPTKDMKQNYTPIGGGSISVRQCRSSSNTNITERSVTAPSIAANDVLVAWSGWTASGVTLTPPSGFTVIDTLSNATAPALVSQMSYRVLTSTVGEPASYSFTSSGAGDGAVWVCSFSGVNTSTPIDVHAVQTTPFGTSHDAPSVTTTAANDLVLLNWFMGCSAGGIYPFTLPPGVTEDVYHYALGMNQVEDLSHFTQASAGATGAKTITLTQTACTSGAPGVTHTVALRAAAPTCPSPASNNWTCTWNSDSFSTGQTMNAGTAQADLYLSNNPVPALRYTSNLAGGSNNVCTLNKPTTVVNGDVMIAACAFRGGSGTTVTSVPSGWSLVGSRVDNSTTISLVVYSHVVTDASSEPSSYSWNLSATVKYSLSLQSYSGIDNTTPIDVSAGQTTASDTSHSTPSITTTVSKDMLLAYFVTATCASWTPAPGMTERTDTTFCSQSQSSNVDMSVDEGLLGNAGVVPALTATNDNAAVGITMAVALKRDTAAKSCTLTVQLTKPIVHRASASAVVNSGTSVTIDKPAGVVDGDVMVASIGMNSATATITPQDAGWTFVSRALNGAGSSVAVYVQVASGEPANYTWDVSAAQTIIGAIAAYSGVDTTTPVDTSGTNATGGNPATASITTAQPAEMLVVSFFSWTSGGASTWSPPSGMAERVEAANTSSFHSYELADAIQPLAGATGAKQATPTPNTNSGASHILALRPAAGSVLGSTTVNATSGGPTLVSGSIATSAVTFADGDRLQLSVVAPSDPVNCASSISFDHPTTPSKLTVATIVPEGVAGLLLVALALPVAARWWHRRRP